MHCASRTGIYTVIKNCYNLSNYRWDHFISLWYFSKQELCHQIYVVFQSLQFYEITGKAYMLIKAYLEDRHQRVIFNDKYFNYNIFSSCGKRKHLSFKDQYLDFFFVPYINDLPKLQIINLK